jgi:acyl transferase domain-containing protein
MSHVSTYGVARSEQTVAIIGIGCRLPGGITQPSELPANWSHIRANQESSVTRGKGRCSRTVQGES